MSGRIGALVAAVALCLSGVSFAQGKPAAEKKGPAKTTATWWGHAAWVIETPGGARIAIDPWLTNPNAPKDAKQPEALDAILLTHGHFDHVGEAKALAQKTGAQVFGAFELVNLLGLNEKQAMGANHGGTFKVKDATIHLVEAVHSSSYSADGKSPGQYSGNPMGYVIQIDNGPTLYHAGDTDAFQSMALIAERFKPTVAMLPIGGHFTMDPVDAAAAAKLLKARTIVPMHYGTFPLLKGTPEELQAALKKARISAKMQAPKPGESVTF